MSRPVQARIDLPALRHNYALALHLGQSGQALPIIKANAYGHGMDIVAATLEPLAPALGVACMEEALALREAGIRKPVLLLEGFFRAEELVLASRHGFWLMLHHERQLAALAKARLARPVTCWLKIDSGMHRLGFAPERAGAVYDQLRAMPAVADEIVLATHFSNAEQLHDDSTERQLRCFEQATATIQAPRSLANSAALMAWPAARSDWNRPGFMLYGHSPFGAADPQAEELRPVMTLRSEVIALRQLAAGETVGYGDSWTASRPSRIATVAIGYGDGYPRRASGKAWVSIDGQRAPVVGRVSMDLLSVDVSQVGTVEIGSEVILWGRDPGLDEVAEWAGTNGYEVMTRVTQRVPRIALS